MATDPNLIIANDWRNELPTLVARQVTLRELVPSDLGSLIDLLSTADATCFGIDEPNTEVAAQQLIDRVARDRSAGVAFSYAITITDPKRLRSASTASAHGSDAARIIASMPGKVVRVLVEVGAQVKAGDAIIVVEAMKMQNEMKSPKAGTVMALNTNTGATVNGGDMLAVIE